MSPSSLTEHQLTVGEVHHNLPPSSLYEHAIRYEKDASIAENGALVAYSGAKTGRSPKDKRIVSTLRASGEERERRRHLPSARAVDSRRDLIYSSSTIHARAGAPRGRRSGSQHAGGRSR